MCTLEKRGGVYILTLTGSGEHRLNPTLLDSIKSALTRLRAEPVSPSSVLVTTAQGKFFSNGYDLAWGGSATSPDAVQFRHRLMSSKLRSVISDLISLPMPTVAAVSGHASAAGMILALSHDYVVMRRDRGFLYLSELDIGLVIPAWFMAVLKCKIVDAKARMEVVLKAAKLTAEMAVEKGIVHSAHDGAEATVEAAIEMGEALVRRRWDGHVYANNRMVVLSEVLDKLGLDETVEGQVGETVAATKSKL
uniref:Delta(3)-Delta(2)-enoyl-CoA isomerase n=1 Tax=Rhizophora mucronata TaxID=61149 RepID=A0A2P2J0D4_RHIMU